MQFSFLSLSLASFRSRSSDSRKHIYVSVIYAREEAREREKEEIFNIDWLVLKRSLVCW